MGAAPANSQFKDCGRSGRGNRLGTSARANRSSAARGRTQPASERLDYRTEPVGPLKVSPSFHTFCGKVCEDRLIACPKFLSRNTSSKLHSRVTWLDVFSFKNLQSRNDSH